MTFEIDLNPHSFVAFMTIAAGVSYIFFNSRTGFGLVKLLTLLFMIIPFAMIGNSLGHSVDLFVGTIIGFLTAKRISWFNPYTRIKEHFSLLRAVNKLNDRLKEQVERSATEDQKAYADEEAARRQEQARQQREQAKAQQKTSGSKSNNSTGSNKESQNKQSWSNNSQQSYQKPKPPSERDKALAVLGLEPGATLAEAKRARAKLMSLYHPDKLAGLPEARRKQAEEEAKKINVAWDLLKKH